MPLKQVNVPSLQILSLFSLPLLPSQLHGPTFAFTLGSGLAGPSINQESLSTQHKLAQVDDVGWKEGADELTPLTGGLARFKAREVVGWLG